METKTKNKKNRSLRLYTTLEIAAELNRRAAMKAGLPPVKVTARLFKFDDAELTAELEVRQPSVSVNAKLNEAACPEATPAQIVAACSPIVRTFESVLAAHGYVWTASQLAPGGVARHADGWKVAVDLQNNGWCHYKGRYDKTTEGKGLDLLTRILGDMAELRAGIAAMKRCETPVSERKDFSK